MTNSYYKNANQGKILEDDKRILIRTSLGDKKDNRSNNYSTDIIFINNKSISDRNYYIENYPDINSSKTNMTIHVNFDNIVKHLLLQRVFNNYYIFTGIIFLIPGIILSYLAII